MGLRDRLVKGPNRMSAEEHDAADNAVINKKESYDERQISPMQRGPHPLLRKSPWVERAEHNDLPAKELKP